ncbi:hypothetical protein FYK55_03825 [Roseiconus nitratireducens]|uniref:Tetratricopeptide repeat protein n=1 Tax=Roseiconus nitratireducens TaxID=2605748 RepID=A0A5M6DIJ8_9BACT|nr:hypothetical protein [Roseiconus nitratireducens]KAA5546042.1 hypothetical protein FYK55_03825 [Roseiconus nitratireducens]
MYLADFNRSDVRQRSGVRADVASATAKSAEAVADRSRPQIKPRIATVIVGWFLISSLVLVQVARGDDQASSKAQTSSNRVTDEEIQDWIEKLGSDSYATRMRARNQLKRFGLQAFDALREAQNHSDSEILSAARYLIGSLQVSWSEETDPKEVREILVEYGAQTDTERLARIQLLGRLPDRMGIAALARVARFDRTIQLSRRAAMLVLKQPMAEDVAQRRQTAERIEEIVSGNDRDASKWLSAYAKDLREGTYGAERWRELVEEQRQIVNTGASKNVDSASVIELIRTLASRAIDEGETDAALALVGEHIDLVPPRTNDLVEHCDWATRHGLYPIVVELYQQNLHLFEENADLLYAAAEAFGQTGREDESQRLAKQALQIEPFPVVADAGEDKPDQEQQEDGQAVSDRRLQEIGYTHFRVARLLRKRGRFQWAERELRYVIEHCDIELSVGVIARHDLAMIYSEQLRHAEATDAIEPIVDRLSKDRMYQARMGNNMGSVNQIRSLYEYETAMQTLAAVDGDLDRLSPAELQGVKERLQLAYRYDSQNIDILIKMFRISDPADPDWDTTVRKQISQNRMKLEKQIADAEKHVKENVIEEWKALLAETLNQYAWLVANTEGDFDRALKASQRSLTMGNVEDPSSRSARLDTLARCYFALGEIETAIETQKEALSLMPHSPPMLRQLAEFEAAR